MPSLFTILLAASSTLALHPTLTTATLTWTSCGTNLDCSTLEVPLEYGDTTSTDKASIALIRYNSTAQTRLGSLLVNPGGPGASGVNFVAAGAGESVSVLSGGLYDVIGWDPRGVGATTPLLECFPNASAEYEFASAFPSGPDLFLGTFSNSSFDAAITANITAFDASTKSLADACVQQASTALFTSSAQYVARDMAAIIDALDGTSSKLNYWGFSYGTILLAEFIQQFPARVGRMVADGVFDSKANAETYVSQLPNDQVSIRDSLNDFASFCTEAGSAGCPFSVAPTGVTGDLATRMDNMLADLFNNPIVSSGISISLDIVNPVLASLLRVPTTWQTLANVLAPLEQRNASSLLTLLSSLAVTAPTNGSAPGVGTLSVNPLQCVDNAPSSSVTLDTVVNLTKSISISENTPLLNAGLTPISFCRNFPDTRPLVANLGASKMSETDTLLAAAGTPILIVSSEHDPTTPLKSAQSLRAMLPNSSKLAVRGGSGHTTVSHVSLGLAEVISAFFVNGTMPTDGAFFAVDQEVFPAGVTDSNLVTPAVFNGTYTTEQNSFLQAVYGIGIAFLSIA